MEKINSIVDPLREDLDVIVTGTLPFSAETEIFLTEEFTKLLMLVIYNHTYKLLFWFSIKTGSFSSNYYCH